ncbi:twin transmembrane helix small protein [Luteimonas sp. e5]
MHPTLKLVLIVGFLIAIVWNLGASLVYMMSDRGESKRTVNALTRRVALSVVLILIVLVSIKMGWIQPHGIGRAP